MATTPRQIQVQVIFDTTLLERLNNAAAVYGARAPGPEKAEAAEHLWYAANAVLQSAQAEQRRCVECVAEQHAALQADFESTRVQAAGVEADLEQRLGVALHQRDVWRDAHNALAAAVGPDGLMPSGMIAEAEAEAADWKERYARLANRVGAMHGGEM